MVIRLSQLPVRPIVRRAIDLQQITTILKSCTDRRVESVL